MATMIEFTGKRNIANQFYKINGQMHDELMQIVNNEIAPKLEGGNKTLRMMHGAYKAFDCWHYSLCLEIGHDGRVWITGCTTGSHLSVKTVTTSPLADIENSFLARIIDHALFCIGETYDSENDTCGLLDTKDFRVPSNLGYTCGM